MSELSAEEIDRLEIEGPDRDIGAEEDAEEAPLPRKTTPETAERVTPQWLYDLLNEEFTFAVDACATPANAKCAVWFGEQPDGSFVDGLTADWYSAARQAERIVGRAHPTVFCNPPYSRGQLRRWLEKAREERDKGCIVVLLIPSDRSTKVWQRYVLGEEIRDLKQRVDFGVGNGAFFASAVVVLWPLTDAAPWVITHASIRPRVVPKRRRRKERAL